jgi:hypothetical protein
MTPEFKPVAQALLQARLDGHLASTEDFFAVLAKIDISPMFYELNTFVNEIEPCTIIPEATKVAEKYGLTLKL